MDFSGFGLHDDVLQGIVAAGYTEPTAIQAMAIAPAVAGKDVVGRAQTGTGKTAAFVLPLLHRLVTRPVDRPVIRGLILAPTRELAQQVHEAAEQFGRASGIRAACVVGGTSMGRQRSQLRRGVDILVATPGRLLDLLQQRALSLSRVEYFVLDEADRMLDMGFIHDVKKLVAMLPKERQTMLFSATFSPEIRSLASTMLRNPETLDAGGSDQPAETIAQEFYTTAREGKMDLLQHLLRADEMQSVLVFSRTKHGADKISRRLDREGIAAGVLHSERSQPQRERALEAFKSGVSRVLVATDIAARGIDVTGISHVVNYDIPHAPEDYVHRIGRTGRAGMAGKAITFVTADDRAFLRRIEQTIGKRVEVLSYPGFTPSKTSVSNVRPAQPAQNQAQAHGRPASRPGRPGFQPRTSDGAPRRKKRTEFPPPRKRKSPTGKMESYSSDRDGGAWSNY